MDLLAWMEQWHMLPEKGGVILCAVSGGRDSVCLLHYLHSISAQCGFSVAAGHYNHHMRPTAQRDEDFVRNLCAELNVPFYTDNMVRVVKLSHILPREVVEHTTIIKQHLPLFERLKDKRYRH